MDWKETLEPFVKPGVAGLSSSVIYYFLNRGRTNSDNLYNQALMIGGAVAAGNYAGTMLHDYALNQSQYTDKFSKSTVQSISAIGGGLAVDKMINPNDRVAQMSQRMVNIFVSEMIGSTVKNYIYADPEE